MDELRHGKQITVSGQGGTVCAVRGVGTAASLLRFRANQLHWPRCPPGVAELRDGEQMAGEVGVGQFRATAEVVHGQAAGVTFTR